MQCNVNNAMNLVCNNTMQGTRKNIVRLEPSCRCSWCECFKKGPFAWKNNPLKMIAQFPLSPPLDHSTKKGTFASACPGALVIKKATGEISPVVPAALLSPN